MLDPKVQSIIASCRNIDQLETCRQWSDYKWGEYGSPDATPQRTMAEAAIQQRECQLSRNAAPEGRHYSPVPGADPFADTPPHTQD